MRPVPRAAVVLTLVVVAMAAASSLATLLWRGAFPDPPPAPVVNLMLAEARGYSAATLLVAIPLALLSLRSACRGSIRGRLMWTGSLAYFVYTYLEFAVSPPFTALYLLYVTAFACAIPALVMGAAVPRRGVAIFSLLLAALLASAWLRDILSRTAAGAFGWPLGADAVGHVVHALDLGLQVPLGIAAGILLLRHRPAGDLLAAIMLANGVCMGGALTGMVAWSSAAAGAAVWSAWPFGVAWAAGIAFAIAFFRPGSGVRHSGGAQAVHPV